MKPLDYFIAISIVGCMFIGYAGHRLIAVLLLALVIILASWRFWDRRRERELGRTASSGELNPERDQWADLNPGHDASSADHGGNHD